ncbi:CBS domain-containing protein [archaeon]|nr:CBS domain-containing protein [archaeon]
MSSFILQQVLVEDLSDRQHPVTFRDELVTHARSTFRHTGVGILPVIDRFRRIVGILRREDVFLLSSTRAVAYVREFMREPVYIAQSTDTVLKACREMLQVGEWEVPVAPLPLKTYLGVLSFKRVVRYIYDLEPRILKETPALEIATCEDIIMCKPDERVDAIWRRTIEKRLSGIPVVDAKRRLIGFVTQTDLLRRGVVRPRFESWERPRITKVENIMTKDVKWVSKKATLYEVVKLMVEQKVSRVPILDQRKRLVGIVDLEDIVRLFVETRRR